MKNNTFRIIKLASVLVFGLMVIGCVTYKGPDAEVVYKEIDIAKRKRIQPNPNSYPAGTGFKLINSGLGNIREIYYLKAGSEIMIMESLLNESFPLFKIRLENTNPKPSVFYISVHPKDPARPRANLFWRMDRIEGLMSVEEAQAIDLAEREA